MKSIDQQIQLCLQALARVFNQCPYGHMSIVDLDELVLRCKGANAKAYLQEAVSCYRAAAYRTCIVATWIAVVFDVIDKLRELALSGDAEARTAIADVDNWQPLVDRGDANAIRKSLEFERNVIGLADQKFGFFEPNQVTDLERLREDRNRCAHPTYQLHRPQVSP